VTAEVSLPLLGGATLVVGLPDGAAPEPDGDLPALAIPNLPGAHVAARRGYRAGAVTLRTACMAAPADGWAAGVEEIILSRATQLAREAQGGDVPPFSAGEITPVGPGFEQRFMGSVRRSDGAHTLRGRHWLGFAGDPREAIVCTAVCEEPPPSPACAGLIAAAHQGGTWTEAPPPSVIARTLLLAAAHPQEALGLLAVTSLATAALVIARRPRPRP
jgi:hypothetical protein